MPVNALLFLLKSVPCEDAILLPRHSVTEENAAGEYIQARELWTREGWAELDFDGSLQPGRPLARLLYNLKHRYAVFRWERDGVRECYVKGPVDLLRIREEDGRAKLDLTSNWFLLETLREELNQRPRGMLTVRRTADGADCRVELDGLAPGEEALTAAVEGLKLFYEEGVPDA